MRPSFSNTPPAYRSLVKLLHVLVIGFVIASLVFGNVPVVTWGLVGLMGLWGVGFGLFGLLARPGPALTGVLRTYFVPMHLVMMGLPGILAIALVNADPGPLTDGPRAVAIATLGLGLLHGIFHLWRHTALGDGALRNMTPRILHGLL